MQTLKCKLGRYKVGSKFVYFTFNHKNKTYERKATVGLIAQLKDKNLLRSYQDFIVEISESSYNVRKVDIRDCDPNLLKEYTELLNTLKPSLNEDQYNILKEEFLKEMYDKGN